MKISKIKKQLGLGLLELTLVLAIIAVILIMATRFYASSAESRKIADASDQVNIIQNAVNQWLLTHSDFSGLNQANVFQDFVNRNYLPPFYVNTPRDPWGGNISAKIDTKTIPSIKVILTNLPESSAKKLQMQYKSLLCQSKYYTDGNPAISSNGKSWDIDFFFPNTCQ